MVSILNRELNVCCDKLQIMYEYIEIYFKMLYNIIKGNSIIENMVFY